jgi:hypothetical protein
MIMPSGVKRGRASSGPARSGSYKGASLLKWSRKNAGWAQIAVAWLAAVAIGIVIYFFPIARLLDSLGQ